MKNKATLQKSSVLFTFIFFLMSFCTMNGQEKGIYEIQTEVLQSSSNLNRVDFYNLAFKLHPTIYLKNNSIRKKYGIGEIKKVIIEDNSSYNLLTNGLSNYKNIQFIVIELHNKNDLNTSLDLSDISNFSKLEYVYIKSYFKCNENDIKNFIKTAPKVRVFYMWGNPS